MGFTQQERDLQACQPAWMGPPTQLLDFNYFFYKRKIKRYLRASRSALRGSDCFHPGGHEAGLVTRAHLSFFVEGGKDQGKVRCGWEQRDTGHGGW